MRQFFERIHARVGDLWWYSAMIFIACRIGDLLNAAIGLWLVPKYVPQSELGAVLPLLQATSAFGLPIAIVVTTFAKFLNKYKTEGQTGKIKSLIRSFWLVAILAILFGTGLSVWLMPHFFERIRVQSGSLGILILATAILSTSAPVFTSGLQALKKFKSITVMNLLSAPVRLITMLIAMPFRALSGYMLGQCLPYVMQIAWSCFSLRKEIHTKSPPVPFWRDDRKAILRYTLFIAGWQGSGAITNVLQSMVIRQRLSELESAAYYMISRFAELGTYVGLSVAIVLFPIAAEAVAKKEYGSKTFWKGYMATGAFGLACTVVIALFGNRVLTLTPTWSNFACYSSDMTILSAILALGALINIFITFEIATGRFGFLWYAIPLTLAQGAFFVSFTGYEFFNGLLPNGVVVWMASLKINKLHNFLLAFLAFHVLGVLSNLLHLFLRKRHAEPITVQT